LAANQKDVIVQLIYLAKKVNSIKASKPIHDIAIPNSVNYQRSLVLNSNENTKKILSEKLVDLTEPLISLTKTRGVLSRHPTC
jgi:hypothetical protein